MTPRNPNWTGSAPLARAAAPIFAATGPAGHERAYSTEPE
ncbi:gamma-glutamylcyclotransferase [Streptomyces brasiliscabiei]